MKALLDKLNLYALNPGTCTGPNGWLPGESAPITSYNPTTGDTIAQFVPTSAADYETAVTHAQTAFHAWRTRPAPQRGLLIRDLGSALRDIQEPLGELISWRWAKSAPKASAKCRKRWIFAILPWAFRASCTA
jgi:aldehyde dehydrogenase (NAD+)